MMLAPSASLLIGTAALGYASICLPAFAVNQDAPSPEDDVAIGTTTEVGPDVLCSVPSGIVDGAPATGSAFPIDAFLDFTPTGKGLTATATRTKWGVKVIVHAPPDVVDTMGAVRTLTAFIARNLEPCPDPFRTLPVSIGVENLDIITEDGVARDFHFGPKD